MVTLLRDHGLPTGQNMVTQQRDHATPPELTPRARHVCSRRAPPAADSHWD